MKHIVPTIMIKRMRAIIFIPELSGHHLEYMHHIYSGVCTMHDDVDFIFVVPVTFIEKSKVLEWPERSNVTFDYIKETECAQYQDKDGVRVSFILASILRSRIKSHKAEIVYSQHLMKLLPAALFMIPRGVRLSGIIYKIYLYDWKKKGWFGRLADVVKYLCFSKAKCFDKILILNDFAAAHRMNKLWHTDRFTYLPDPFIPLSGGEQIDLRAKYSIEGSDLILAHFGSLSLRKGTMTILDSIADLPLSEKRRCVFFFAGRLRGDIREQFYNRLKSISDARIVIEDRFCSFDYLYSLCSAADGILIPYQETGQSSGIIGYASQFGVPVVAPASGLLGKLVRFYSLGITLEKITPDRLIEAYSHIGHVPKPSDRYCQEHTVNAFCAELSELFIK